MFHVKHRTPDMQQTSGRSKEKMDYEKYFEKYRKIVDSIDKVFQQIKEKYPDCVRCKVECSDCCHALFDVSLVEAMYISKKFREKFVGQELEKLLERANKADREAFKLKKAAYREFKDGKEETRILEEMAEKRVRCAMLDDSDKCRIYEFRPITCRIYGVPTAIGGKGHTCGLSGFKEGENYPTVNLDILHEKLHGICREISIDIQSKYPGLADILVPLSMAILTDYDDEYMGIGTKEKKGEEDKNGGSDE
jgi:Fe-S-cluster containining protein